MRALVLENAKLKYEPNYQSITASKTRSELIEVKVLQAGICETDLQLVQGYMQFQGTLGHEFCGIAQSGKYAGQRVVGEINCGCNNCDVCQMGLVRHCPNRTVIGILNHDGAFADTVLVPEQNLLPVPDSVFTSAAVFVEPLAAAFEILEQVQFKPSDKIGLLGDGRLGNLCAQVLQTTPAKLTVLGKHDSKLKHLDAMGINTTLVTNCEPTRQFDYVIDCTGSPTGIETALGYVRPRGTVILKTTVAGTQTLSLAPFVIDEITLLGSRCGLFAPAIDALAQKQIKVDYLIDSIHPLEEGLNAFERAQSPGVMKVLLDINPE